MKKDTILTEVNREESSAAYQIADKVETKVNRYILSTPETRAICNDPLILGYEYTEKLEAACSTFFRLTAQTTPLALQENRSVVFNILRGGLNFGLRDALAKAFGWNTHSSSFVTAQRARTTEDSEQWHITEDEYKKVTFPQNAQIVIGDVVCEHPSFFEEEVQRVLYSSF